MASPGEITRILNEARAGDAVAREAAIERLYSELRALASGYLRRERPGHTLQPTALVHEAWLRLERERLVEWSCRGHFLAIAATVMRRLLSNHARERRAAKRGGGQDRVTLSGLAGPAAGPDVDVIALAEALESLEREDPRLARVVELRFFSGLSQDEVAAELSVDVRTVKRWWRAARLLLYERLQGDEERPAADEAAREDAPREDAPRDDAAADR